MPISPAKTYNHQAQLAWVCLVLSYVKLGYGAPTFITQFHDSRCPPNFNGTIIKNAIPYRDGTDCYLDISAIYPIITKEYLTSNEQLRTSSTELNKILNIFETTHSLILVTDFRGVPLGESNYPIILQQIRLGWEWHPNLGEARLQPRLVGYMPDEMLKEKAFDSQHYTKHLVPEGSDGMGESLKTSTYIELDIPKFWNHVRPWNNMVSIVLFPHIQLYSEMSNCQQFMDYVIHVKNPYNIFPSGLPPIRIFVIHPTDLQDIDQVTGFIIDFAKHTIGTNPHFQMSNEIFLIADVRIVTICKLIRNLGQVVIRKLSYIHLCRKGTESVLTFVPTSKAKNLAIILNEMPSSAMCSSFASENNILIYFKNVHNQKFDLAFYLTREMQTCQHKYNRSSEVARIGKSYENVLLSVLGNFSYMDSSLDKWFCDNGNIVASEGEDISENRRLYIYLKIEETFFPPEASTTLYPAVVTSIHDDLKFLSCSNKRFAKLPFAELVNLFDTCVWLVLAAFVIALALIFHSVPTVVKSISVMEGILIMTKLFLEQGSPFPNSIITNRRCKCMAVTLLLMGIILCNAYKNANVYNMISPRKPVPYKYLEELVTDNFTIYSRSVKFHAASSLRFWLGRGKNNPKSFEVSEESEPHYYTYYFLSSAMGTNMFHYLWHKSDMHVLQKVIESGNVLHLHKNLARLAFRASTLLYITSDFLQTLLKQVELLNISKLTKSMTMDERHMLMSSELGVLLNQLKSCNNIAVLLPSDLGYQWKKILEKEGHSFVYQGEEIFYDKSVAITMKGMVPQYLVKRAKYAERCGL